MSDNQTPKEEAAEQIVIEAYRDTLRRIKLTCLTAQNSTAGLTHIIRLCLDAGISQKLDELRELEDKRMGREH